MDFALMTEPQLGMTYEEQLRTALLSERIGLSVWARSDHFDFPGFESPHATEAFASLAALAEATDTIRLCVLVSPITFRHPGIIAKTAATIDEISGGRLTLGVGTGWMEEEHELLGLEFPETGERFDRFEEALAYLRAAFDPGGGGFRGDHYTLADRPLRPTPQGIEIVVGGSGPRRTPRLAGTFADEFNVFAGPPQDIAVRVERARLAAAEAGRDPDGLRVSIMGQAVSGPDEAAYRANLEKVATAHPFGRGPDEIEDALRGRGLPCGPPEVALEALEAFAAAGVERFYVQTFGPFEDGFIESVFEGLRV